VHRAASADFLPLNNPRGEIVKYLFLLALLCAGAVQASGGGATGAPGVVKMDLLVVNLESGRYVGFTPQIKLADPADEGYVKASVPLLRHEMIKELVGQKAATAQSAEFIAGYAKQLATGLNRLLKGDYVKEVLFDNWVVR
jgi:flagellar basal body-associated protein FliL